MTSSPRSGFVSIVGKPNVGKSTLLNRLVGEHLAGVSRKPQTTRGIVRGILSTAEGQAVFLDTPGFHDARDRLGEWMLGQIRQAIASSDLIYWMVFPSLPREDDLRFGQELAKSKSPLLLLINQVDRIEKPKLLPVIDAYRKLGPFREVIPVSALHGDNVPILVRKTFELLPKNPPYFSEDLLTDQSEREIVKEMIREKIFRFTGEEIPYSSAVEIEDYKERLSKGGSCLPAGTARTAPPVVIKATIVVEKDSQKAILIGKGGAKIKQIGEAARKEIESFLSKKVFLELWVKTLRYWKRDPEALRRLGFS